MTGILLPEAEQDAGYTGSGLFVRRIVQVADEKQLLSVRREKVCPAERFVSLGRRYGPFLNPRSPVDVAIMLADLPLQFPVGRIDRAESGKIAASCLEIEVVDIPTVRLAHEKGVTVFADGRQLVQLALVSPFGHFLERSAECFRVNAEMLAQGLYG